MDTRLKNRERGVARQCNHGVWRSNQGAYWDKLRGFGLNGPGQYPDFKHLTKRLTAYGTVVFAEFSIGGKDAVTLGLVYPLKILSGRCCSNTRSGKLNITNHGDR